MGKKWGFLLTALAVLLLASGCDRSASITDMPEEASVYLGTGLGDIGLPTQVRIKSLGKTLELNVDWVGDFDGNTPGVYELRPSCEGYRFRDGVTVTVLPQYQVADFDVVDITTTAGEVPELPQQLSATDVYGRELSVPVASWGTDGAGFTDAGEHKLSPALSTEFLCVEPLELTLRILPSDRIVSVAAPETVTFLDNGQFEPSALPAPVATDEYGNEFPLEGYRWSCPGFDASAAGEYVFTLSADAALGFDGELPALTVIIAEAPYVAPAGYYAPVYEARSFGSNGVTLTKNVMGVRVKMVQQALGLRIYDLGKWGYYRWQTETMVRVFQLNNGLPTTGEVDFDTWKALGLSETDWETGDCYVSPVQITDQSTRSEIIDVFMRTAEGYIGSDYVYGACGPEQYGADCSGLVLQCMFNIGIYPDGLSPIQHTNEEYNSRLMWADDKLVEVPFDELAVGDLVFYHVGTDPTRTVMHVAIYAGDNKCIESYGTHIGIYPLQKQEFYNITGIKRIIAA